MVFLGSPVMLSRPLTSIVVIANATGLDVTVATDPMTCVAEGTSIYLENLEVWKAVLESDMDG